MFWKKRKVRFREFITYIDPIMMNTNELAMRLVQKANGLGLRGKKIENVIRRESPLGGFPEIWFEGEF